MKEHGDKDIVTEYLMSAYTNPSKIASVIRGRWEAKGISEDTVEKSWAFFHSIYKDVKMDIVEQLSDGGSVFSLVKITAEANDGPCVWTAMHFHRLRNGVITDGSCGVHGAI